MDKIEVKNGQFAVSASARERIDEIMKQTGATDDPRVHRLMAEKIFPPIKQMADYVEWTKLFYEPVSVAPGEIVRQAIDTPTAVALYNSIDGQVLFTRPGRGTYVSPEFVMVDTALEIGWDDLLEAGWDVLGTKMSECSQELARKRDEQGQLILDAATAVAAGHQPTVGGGLMTKAAIDSIFKLAAAKSWKIDRVVLNTGTIMDMTSWVLPANSMWANMGDGHGEEIMRQGFVTNYGGAAWYAYHTVPANFIYLSASPQVCGAKRWKKGGTRTASDINIVNKTDLHTWDEKYGHYWGNPFAVWRLGITA